MAREIHKFSVTVPKTTPKATPQLTNLTMPARVVTRITIIVPPGPRGALGFALAAAGRAIMPYEPGAFFVADNEKIDWDVDGQISSGAWQLLAYNTGSFDHTLEIRFMTDLPEQLASTSPALIPAGAIQPSSGTAVDGSGLPGGALPPLPPLPPPPPLPPGLDGAPPLEPFGPPGRGRPHPVGGSVGPLLP